MCWNNRIFLIFDSGLSSSATEEVVISQKDRNSLSPYLMSSRMRDLVVSRMVTPWAEVQKEKILSVWEYIECPTVYHYNGVIMGSMAAQIASLTIVYSAVYSGANQKKTSKLRVTGLSAGNSPGTGVKPVTMTKHNTRNVYIYCIPNKLVSAMQYLSIFMINSLNSIIQRLFGRVLLVNALFTKRPMNKPCVAMSIMIMDRCMVTTNVISLYCYFPLGFPWYCIAINVIYPGSYYSVFSDPLGEE